MEGLKWDLNRSAPFPLLEQLALELLVLEPLLVGRLPETHKALHKLV